MSEEHLIIVDGYNLIHRTPDLRPGPDRTLEEARDKLINLLSWAVGSGDARFVVVFDGSDEATDFESGSDRVRVRWSRPPAKADDLIRKIVEREIDRGIRLTVVTADLEVARHARAMGANISLSDLFIGSVLGPQRIREGSEKPGTLGKKEIEEWAELFKKRERESAEE